MPLHTFQKNELNKAKTGWLAYKEKLAYNILYFCILPNVKIKSWEQYSFSIQNYDCKGIREYSFRKSKTLPENPVFHDSRSNMWPGPEAHVAAEEGRLVDSSSSLYESFLDEMPHVCLSNGLKLRCDDSYTIWASRKYKEGAFYISTQKELEDNMFELIEKTQPGLNDSHKRKSKNFILSDLLDNKYIIKTRTINKKISAVLG